jgi:pyruvate, water dikinase
MPEFISRILNKVSAWRRGPGVPSNDRVSRVFKFKYACFKDLLASNTELLNIITDFEQKLRGQEVFGMSYVRSQATRAVFHTLRMVKSLDDLSGHRYPMLFETLENINLAVKEELGKRKELPVSEWVLPYSAITKEMVDWVGGKNANLGEMRNRPKLPIPEGFAITTRAYDYLLEYNELSDEIARMRMDLDASDPQAVNEVSEKIQRLIILARVPEDLEKAIFSAYDAMAGAIQEKSGSTDISPHVALRSSAIGEDSELSYAGQYVSILNVTREKIVETYKYVVASLYTPRAIAYRLNKGMRDEDIAMSVACIEMIESIASGVIYSRHPFNFLEDNVLVTAVWGLGPYAVEGVVTPDSYTVSKDAGRGILKTIISHKPVQLIAVPTGGLQEVPVDPDKQDVACLSPEQIKVLAGHAIELEKHYGQPQDMEWALDRHGRLLMLQTRPLGLDDMQKDGRPALPAIQGYEVVLEGGSVACPGVGCGQAYHVSSMDDLIGFPEGGILVAKHSSPEFVVVMQKAQAIISDAGSVTGHMASVAREFGVPTILGAQGAFSEIPDQAEITVDAYSGRVYQGKVEELLAVRRTRESAMKETPVYQTLRRVADWIVPLHLVNPRATNFAPEYCKTLHDIMRFVHELSYREMFSISDAVSDTEGAGALQLTAPIPLDLHIIDLGGGLTGVSPYSRRVTVDQVCSVPFAAVLRGMLHKDLRNHGPRPIDLGGFFSVVREQMFSPNNMAERFGDRSYAILSDYYLNFSSRIGYHYSVLDSFCGDTTNKNYITFSFKGGAADEVRRNRRARAIALIFRALDFTVEQREDRVDARFYKYERDVTEGKLDIIGRMLQFTRQMDMLMKSEASVEVLAKSFLDGNYQLDDALLHNIQNNGS